MKPVLARPAPVWPALLGIAAVRFAVPMVSTLLAPIGYTPDELYYLACADHLAFGYVDHPPFSIVLLSAIRLVLGDSLLALRVVPALCESLAVVTTALLARELGGGRQSQVVAALAMAAVPITLTIGLPYSMNPLEHLLWPVAALLLARIQNGADSRWWLVLGAVLGVALENKLSTSWLGIGFAVGLVASPARWWLGTRWPWLAAGVAAVVLAPHIAWQIANDWPTLEFFRNNATAREGVDAAVVIRSPLVFALAQVFAAGPLAAPLWILGLVHLLRAPGLAPHRALGWAFAVTFAIVAASGRGSIYYLAGAFPIVFAAGAVAFEQLARGRARALPFAVCAVLVLQAAILTPFLVPLVDADRYLALARGARAWLGADPDAASLPPVYQWMAGGYETTAAAARVVETLPESDRHRVGILATTFGEAGALRQFGSATGLPPVIGTHNNFWLWGTRGLDGSVLIVVADRDSPVLQNFESCHLADRIECPHCEAHLNGRPVFVCRDPVRALSELWPGLKDFF